MAIFSASGGVWFMVRDSLPIVSFALAVTWLGSGAPVLIDAAGGAVSVGMGVKSNQRL